jgi:hypothetical protein
MKKLLRPAHLALIGLLALNLNACDSSKTLEDMAASKNAGISSIANGTSNATAFAYIVKSTETVLDNSRLNLPAGSIIGIEAGERRELTIRNFKGTSAQPYIFINTGGKTTFKVSTSISYGWRVENCSFLKITGSGSTDKYGINIDGGHQGLILGHLSSDIEVERLEVQNCGFAGIMAKTDPTCDPATWRGNYEMKNVKIHNNWVHHTKGEGLYIGNSFYAQGMTRDCGTVYPHNITDLKVYNNIVTNTGAEAIQVGCAIRGCEIYNNTVRDAGGDPFAAHQNNGIQISAGTGGKLYNNTIINVGGTGIMMFGTGDNHVYNNLIVNASQAGIFADERFTTGDRYVFANNTIYNVGTDGIRMYSKTVTHYVANNLIVAYKGRATSTLSSTTKVVNENNITTNDVASVKFVDTARDNFRIMSGSIAHDSGINTSKYGVTTDLYHIARPQGRAYDAGAAELIETIVITEPTPQPAPSTEPVKTNKGKGNNK